MRSRGRMSSAAVVSAAVGTAAVVAVVRAATGLPTAMGAASPWLRGADERAARAGSAPTADGLYHNTIPDPVVQRGSLLSLLRALAARGPIGRPSRPVPVVEPEPPGPEEGGAPLAVTWYGHSSVLLEVDGHRVLADPVWSERASPSPTLGPRRLHPVPVALSSLPPVDAVVISHDHYDHLDLPTVRALVRGGTAPFVVPLGVGAHLRRWGVPAARVVELDWNDATTVGGLTLTCTEARHFSGRSLRRNTTLWSSWAVTGPSHRVFFGGDSGYTPAFADIGRSHGPFDLTLLPIGAYSDRWPLIHMTPEEAVRAHGDLTGGGTGGGGLLVPVHWATFNLGFHTWAEPPQRLVAAADEAGVRVAVPRPGGRVDVARALAAAAEATDWWTAVD